MIPSTIQLKLNEKGQLDENGKEASVDKFAIGALTGLKMAIQDLQVSSGGQFKEFQMRDQVTIECVDVMPQANGQSPMPVFVLNVTRA